MSEPARVIIEVQGGIIPGEPIEKYTKRWAVTSADYQEAQANDEAAGEEGEQGYHTYLLLAGRAALADEYARVLRNPQILNWTRTDWIWL